jgi:hypothetical protein
MACMTYPDTPYPGDDEPPALDRLLNDARLPLSRDGWTQQMRDQAAQEGLDAVAAAAARPRKTVDELLADARLIDTGDPEDAEERSRAMEEWNVRHRAWLASRTPAEVAADDQKRLELPNGLTMDEEEDFLTFEDEVAAHMRTLPLSERRDLWLLVDDVDRRSRP